MYNYLMGGKERKVVFTERTRDNVLKVKHMKFYLNTTFFPEGGQALEQATQRDCGVSITGGIKPDWRGSWTSYSS